ncbi:choice-of-anchor Q domain-containing protein [Chloroflexota bacterium]
MKRLNSISLAIILALALGLVGALPPLALASPGTIYVDNSATGANNGTSWADAYTSLQSALGPAVSGDEIRVAQGTYKPSVEVGGTGDRYKCFQLKNDVAIYGGYAGYGKPDPDARNISTYPTILSGNVGTYSSGDNSYHVFYHPDGTNLNNTAVLDGCIIIGGNANALSNPHDQGGGMYNWACEPTVTNCSFITNTASNGGGGMFNLFSTPILTNCSFITNTASLFGGGMYNFECAPTVTNCSFIDNIAGFSGGGIGNDVSSPTLTNCTFIGNTASVRGGGMSNLYSSPTVTNCIFWNNTPNEIYDESSNPYVTYCDVQGGYSGSGNINANPLLNATLHLMAGSPCIDAGNNFAPAIPATDFEGDPRLIDDPATPDTGLGTPHIVDMGADEYLGQPSVMYTQQQLDDAVAAAVEEAVAGLYTQEELDAEVDAALDQGLLGLEEIKSLLETPQGQRSSLSSYIGEFGELLNEIIEMLLAPPGSNISDNTPHGKKK